MTLVGELVPLGIFCCIFGVSGIRSLLKRRRRIRKIYLHPTTRFPDEDCCICLDSLRNPENNDCVVRSKCKHYFHKQCLADWIRSENDLNVNCPLCVKTFY